MKISHRLKLIFNKKYRETKKRKQREADLERIKKEYIIQKKEKLINTINSEEDLNKKFGYMLDTLNKELSLEEVEDLENIIKEYMYQKRKKQ